MPFFGNNSPIAAFCSLHKVERAALALSCYEKQLLKRKHFVHSSPHKAEAPLGCVLVASIPAWMPAVPPMGVMLVGSF